VTQPSPSAAHLAALERHFRGHDQRDWREWAPFRVDSAADSPLTADRAWLKRVGTSHRGIGERRSVRHLIVDAADQACLDEVCTLDGLERLELGWPVTAGDLSGLRRLVHLLHLRIDSPRNVADFTPVLELPAMRQLLIENAKHLSDAGFLADAHHLEVIGLEGSLWTRQRVASLEPFRGLRSLRALLLTSVRLGDKDLGPLADCPRLELLACARFVPRPEFERLHGLRPELACTWFDPASWV
jgi:hypothetical protein